MTRGCADFGAPGGLVSCTPIPSHKQLPAPKFQAARKNEARENLWAACPQKAEAFGVERFGLGSFSPPLLVPPHPDQFSPVLTWVCADFGAPGGLVSCTPI